MFYMNILSIDRHHCPGYKQRLRYIIYFCTVFNSFPGYRTFLYT